MANLNDGTTDFLSNSIQYSLDGGATWINYIGSFNSNFVGVNTSILVRVAIVDDAVPDNNETFSLTVSPTGSTNFVGIATIKDDGTGVIFNPNGSINTTAVKDRDTETPSVLLHMDGDGGNTFVDYSNNNLYVTANGDVKIKKDQSKFGGSSAYFMNNSSISVDSELFEVSGDWTFECWIRPISTIGYNCIFQNDVGGAEVLRFYVKDGKLVLRNGTNHIVEGDITTNTWHHVALVRSGGIYHTYLDGIKSTVGYNNTQTVNNYFRIGHDTYSSSNQGFKGWIDEIRITKDVARYVEDFTPQTAPFQPTSSYQQIGAADPHFDNVTLLLHCGPDFGNVFIDSSFNQYPVTNIGDVTTNSNFYKVGGASGRFNNGNKLQIQDVSSANLGISDFTIEFWIISEGGSSSYISDFYMIPICGTANINVPSVYYILDSSQNVSFTVTQNSDYFNHLEIIGIKDFPENNTPNPETIFVNSGTYGVTARNNITWKNALTRPDPTNSKRVQSADRIVNGVVEYPDAIQVTASVGNFISADINPAIGGWIIGVGGSNGESIVWKDSSGFSLEAINPRYALSNWTHVAVSRESGIMRIFINGILKNTGISTANLSYNLPLNIGGDNSSVHMTGYVDEFKIHNGYAKYTSNFNPFGEDGVLLYMDGEYDSNIFTDSSSNNLNVIPSGNVKTSYWPVMFGHGSAYFDGDGDYLTIIDPNNALTPGIKDFTLECWIYTIDTTTTYRSVWRTSYDDTFRVFIWNQFNWLMLRVDSTEYFEGTNVTTPGGTGFNNNEWVHIAVVRSNGIFTLYKNGIPHIIVNNKQNYSIFSPIDRLGASHVDYEFYLGYIDQAIFKNIAHTYPYYAKITYSWTTGTYLDTYTKVTSPILQGPIPSETEATSTYLSWIGSLTVSNAPQTISGITTTIVNLSRIREENPSETYVVLSLAGAWSTTGSPGTTVGISIDSYNRLNSNSVSFSKSLTFSSLSGPGQLMSTVSINIWTGEITYT